MNRHIRNTILLLCLFVTISFVTFSYAAFNQTLMITGGDAMIVPLPDRSLSHYVETRLGQPGVEQLGGGVRYVGSSPNNYVYYNGETWRIIGVFDVNTASGTQKLTKIIREDPVEIMSWNTDWSANQGHGKNDFANSSMLDFLYNNFYYKSYGNWGPFDCRNGTGYSYYKCDYKGLTVNSASMVEKVYWNLGSTNPYQIGVDNVFTPAFLRQSENGSAQPNACSPVQWDTRCTENDTRASSVLTYIGLPYPSDLAYAVGSTCSDNTVGSSCAVTPWTNKPGPEWTISPAYSTSYGDTVIAMYQGHLWSESCTNTFGVRPTLYLKAEVNYAGGSGTSADPILLTYNGAIGIEPGLTNYAPQGDPVADPEPEEPVPTPTPGPEPTIPEGVTISISPNARDGWANHYLIHFSIVNHTGSALNNWTLTLTPKSGVTIETENSFMSSQLTATVASSNITINSLIPYNYNNNHYVIEDGETFDTSTFITDGAVGLIIDSNMNLSDLFNVSLTTN